MLKLIPKREPEPENTLIGNGGGVTMIEIDAAEEDEILRDIESCLADGHDWTDFHTPENKF